MNIQDAWDNALKNTEIIRPRVQPLSPNEATPLPYILLSPSGSTTIVRRGEVVVEKPAIVLPHNMPQFEGFDFEKEMEINGEFLKSFFLVRGVRFPSLKYQNTKMSQESYAGSLPSAVQHFADRLQREENVLAGLMTGPSETWPMSVLVFVCGQVVQSAEGDIRRLLEGGTFTPPSLS
jgi:hypothetical protein